MHQFGGYTSAGVKIGSYQYDAWGNCTESVASGITAMQRNIVRNFNPFRYRGYYYDVETSLYYLQSRYYDPAMGRFLNADGYVNANGDMIGFNMYVYCSNNPIKWSDETGCSPVLAAWAYRSVIAGLITQVVVSVGSYAGMAIASIWDKEIRNDMKAIGWNPFNSDSDAVMGSSKVSFLKGVPVFTDYDGRSGSFYAILFDQSQGEDILKHERGHNWQAMTMGPLKYATMIGLPSWLEWSDRAYKNRPWEITAEHTSGVSRSYRYEDLIRGYGYWMISGIFGPLGYLFLFGEY